MLRRIVMCFVIADNWVTRLSRSFIKSKWVLDGKCNKCGKCCQEIKLYIDPKLANNNITYNIIVWWVSWLFRFDLIGIDRERSDLIFTCKMVSKDGKCTDYKWRPNICRNYPIVDYFDEPVTFKTCGYKARLRAAKGS